MRGTRDAYRRRGFTVELNEIPDHDHNYYKRSAEINARDWEFLRQHRLAGAARYKEHHFRPR